MSFKRLLITWFDIHGIRHQASRHVNINVLLAGLDRDLEFERNM